MPGPRPARSDRAIPRGVPANPTTGEVFALMSWRDRRLAAISQAGLVEKFVDALVWVILPVFLYQRGVSLPEHRLDRRGLWLRLGRLAALHRAALRPCRPALAERARHVDLRRRRRALPARRRRALVVVRRRRRGLRHGAALPQPLGGGRRHLAACLARLGDRHLPLLARPRLRASAGSASGSPPSSPAALDAAFWFVAVSMFLSGALLLWWGEETHPRLNPAAT